MKFNFNTVKFIICLLLVFIVLPYSIWLSDNDMKKIEKYGKLCTCNVSEINGLKGNNIEIECLIQNKKIINVSTAPFEHNIRIGDYIIVKYDSTDFNNLIVLWDSIL